MLRQTTAVVLAAAALAVLAALASPAPAAAGEKPCWERLLDDWVLDARIDKTYPAACYREAIKRLEGDLKDYSSAEEDFRRALSAAISKNDGRTPSIVEPPDDQREPQVLPGIGDPDDPTSNGSDRGGGLFEALLPRATGAASVPLPLLILAGLAMLLLAAAGVSFAARRLQAHRAPADGPPQP